MKSSHIVFGGGCFWCIEAAFSLLRGVTEVLPGYAGGQTEYPTYEQVSQGTTGHAEIVYIAYDPTIVTLKQLLAVFFTVHDPTTLNRQGADIGSQYRSIILCSDKSQFQIVQTFIKTLTNEGLFSEPIVTEVALLEQWYPAEAEHQQYYQRNPQIAYCQAVINPKLKKLRSTYSSLIK